MTMKEQNSWKRILVLRRMELIFRGEHCMMVRKLCTNYFCIVVKRNI